MLHPESRGHRTYCEAFARQRNLLPSAPSKEKLLSDMGAHAWRVSAACLAVQDCFAGLERVAAQTSAAEDKVLSATKLVRLAQTYSEEQGREQAAINDALEERLAHLERKVENVDMSALAAASIRPSGDTGAKSGGYSRHGGLPPPLSGSFQGEPLVDSPGLSRWIQDVDQRLGELHSLVVSRGTTATPMTGVAVDCATDAQICDIPIESTSETARTSHSPTRVASRSMELDLVEERVRLLEERISETNVTATTLGMPDTKQEVQHVHEEPIKGSNAAGISRKLESLRVVPGDITEGIHDSTTAVCVGGNNVVTDGVGRPEDPSRFPSRRCSRSGSNFPAGTAEQGGEIGADGDGGAATQPTLGALLEAIEKGREEASKAREAAQEALRIGREAAERSERTESLAKTMAVRSMKFVREQHDHINSALGRLDKKLRERGAMGAICLQESGVKTTKPRCDAADSDPAGPRITSSHSSSDSEIDSRFEEASGGPTCYSRGNCDGDTRLRRRGRQWLDSAEGRKATIPTTDDGVSSTTSSVKQEPQSELAAQNTAECRPRKGRVALDASCGRRTARTALGSMDVESFGPDDERGCTEYIEQKQQGTHTNGGEVRSSRRRRGDKRRSRAPAGNLETADKMQGATRAQDYTAPGLQSSYFPRERQRSSARCSRSGSPPWLRPGLCCTRDRTTAHQRAERNRLAGYWVPPGNIPCKIGERRGAGVCPRMVWDPAGLEEEESKYTTVSSTLRK